MAIPQPKKNLDIQTLRAAKYQWTPAVSNKAGPDNLRVTDIDSPNSTNFHVMSAA